MTASSGIAGVLIGGCTIHATLGINVSLVPPAQEKHTRTWSLVTFLFLEEISMVQPALLHLIDLRLQQLQVQAGRARWTARVFLRLLPAASRRPAPVRRAHDGARASRWAHSAARTCGTRVSRTR